LDTFNGKKITELSEEEMEASFRKVSRGNTLRNLPTRKEPPARMKKTKTQIIKEMHLKIKEKCRNDNPTLSCVELKVLSAIILIQKIWKQTKVKSIIGEFLSPRKTPLTHPYAQTFGKALLIHSGGLKPNTTMNINS
jgi:hypothetical protein